LAPKNGLRLSCALFLATVLAACTQGTDIGTGDEHQPPARLRLVSGGGQNGQVGSELPLLLRLSVTDTAGFPVSGVIVKFVADTQGGVFAPDASRTDHQGIAEVQWTIGPHPGTATGSATVAGLEPVLVSAIAVPGPPDPARSTVSADFPILVGDSTVIRIAARDAFDNPLEGAPIHLILDGSAGTLLQPAMTDSAGMATGIFRGTTPGAGTLTVDAGGVLLDQTVTVTVMAPPVVGTVTVTPAEAGTLVGQSIGLTATVRDDHGAVMQDAVVDWASSDRMIATVDAQGIVTGRSPGVSTLSATAGGQSGSARISVSYGEGRLTGLTYCTIAGINDLMDVYVPSATKARPLPVAVHVHGGGWANGSRSSGGWFSDVEQELLQRGYLVVSLDYRLAPKFKYPSQIQDVKCAIRHLRANASRYGLDQGRIGAWGLSAGGQLVALLGSADASSGFDQVGGYRGISSRVQAVVAISPITDFTHIEELHDDYSREFATWPQPDSPELIEASPVTHVTADDPPFFFVVGAEDALVLPAQSERMDSFLRADGVETSLLSVLHADHDIRPTTAPTEPDAATIVTRMADFLDRHLR